MTRAGRWLRVSTSGQDEASQEPDIDRWIEQRGYEVAETYRVHGESAYHGKQEPELRQMIADMKSGKIEVLVVWKSDRLERRGAYALMGLIAEATKAGGRIEFVIGHRPSRAEGREACRIAPKEARQVHVMLWRLDHKGDLLNG
jgi:DNA invertase Pin-like site-specific DNA recombinase